ncbi:hypothetical protein [Bosea sp. (in: a-proteobacteria)]|uniref:hypothetical protein n=1 Tax=Bosea sp. (in: a-proteobacteria) TaxID=1871050 RepID=UPI001ACF0D3E|nr:hypothetical protein [Bosea sp. (in: a-proteobacteria)]MBN9435813.1 hypothetical protein [Bosea sp. (in: a-proteobacteria)]
MHRRDLLIGSALCALSATAITTNAWGASAPNDQPVAALLSWLRSRADKPTSAVQLAGEIRKQANQLEARVLAFELVRAMPYRLARFDAAKPDGLFQTGYGDCRHKAAALNRLFQALGETSRPILMAFDWKDLPIPRQILAPLDETRGFHDCVEIEINRRFVLADATWDPGLLAAGFPGSIPWDGLNPTSAITDKASSAIHHASYKSYGELFERYRIRWPQREKTLAFNRLFNRWASNLRDAGALSARR